MGGRPQLFILPRAHLHVVSELPGKVIGIGKACFFTDALDAQVCGEQQRGGKGDAPVDVKIYRRPAG